MDKTGNTSLLKSSGASREGSRNVWRCNHKEILALFLPPHTLYWPFFLLKKKKRKKNKHFFPY
jgi:hypothetical protein